MIDKEAIAALQQGEAISSAVVAVGSAIGQEPRGVLALPSEYAVHDLERMLPLRRRARGSMTTSAVEDFAAYVLQHKHAGAAVFVDQGRMSALAVLNLGTATAPGHADNTATLQAQASAAYTALRAVANGAAQKQQTVAEFLEDWPGVVKCYHEGTEISPPKAIAAVRTLTLESMRKLEASEGQLSASRSTFESVKASSGPDPLPTHVYFSCAPYLGLAERTFVLRVGVRADEKAPGITLRVVNAEQHAEDMAAELANLVRGALGAVLPVLVGAYRVAA